MQTMICTLPLVRIPIAPLVACNDDQFQEHATPTRHAHAACKANVRWMCRSKDIDCNRFALSGKLADVCAALDELAAQEVRNAWKCASY